MHLRFARLKPDGSKSDRRCGGSHMQISSVFVLFLVFSCRMQKTPAQILHAVFNFLWTSTLAGRAGHDRLCFGCQMWFRDGSVDTGVKMRLGRCEQVLMTIRLKSFKQGLPKKRPIVHCSDYFYCVFFCLFVLFNMSKTAWEGSTGHDVDVTFKWPLTLTAETLSINHK